MEDNAYEFLKDKLTEIDATDEDVKIYWREPNLLRFSFENEEAGEDFTSDTVLCREALNQLNCGIGFSNQFGRQLFNQDADTWRSLVMKKLMKNVDSFKLNQDSYLTVSLDGCGYTIVRSADGCKEALLSVYNGLDEVCADYRSYRTELSIKTICVGNYCSSYLETNDLNQYSIYPCLVVSFSPLVQHYSGIGGYLLMEKESTNKLFVPVSRSFKESTFSSFTTLDVKSELDYLSKMVNLSVTTINNILGNDKLISAREILDLLKLISADVVLDDEGFVAYISNVIDRNSNDICKALNSFNIPYKSLKKLSPLRKCLKSDGISALDMMYMLTEEVLYSDNIDADGEALEYLQSLILGRSLDSMVVEDELL